MAVTRIKNNQITDSTITAAKIASGTLTGGLFAADITLASNVTITGNLVVSGASDSISATNTYVNDPLVVFNNGFVGSPSYDIGILVNRNLTATAPYGSVNAALIWRESDKAFTGVMTTETGTTTGTINNSGFANLKIGNVTANSLTLTTGTLTASSGITGTPISGSTGYFTVLQGTAFSTGNAVISGGYISALTNATITTATITAAGVTTLQASNFNSANAVISGGYISALTNATITTATIGTLNAATEVVTVLSATSGNVTTLYAGSINTANAVITGGYINNLANLTATTAQATNFSTGNARITGGYADNFPIGANTAATGAFTTLAASGIATLNGNVVAAAATTSTSTTTGGLVAVGGAGIGGNLNVGGNITATSASTNITGTRFVTTNGLFWANGVNALSSAYSNVDVGGYLSATTVPQANVSIYEQLTNSTTNSTFYPAFYDKATGNAAAYTNTSFSVNPSTGALTATSLNGNHYGTTAQFTNFSTGNAVISGGYISALTNATVTTATVTTLNAVTATAATLNATAGNVTTLYAGSLNTANAVISGGYINNLANLTATTAQATNFSSGNIVFTNATSGTVSTANVSLYDSIAATTTNATFYPQIVDKAAGNVATYTASSFTINPSTGLLSATTFSGAGAFTTAAVTNFSTGNAVISGGYISALTNATVTTGSFGTLTATTLSATAGNVTTLYAGSMNTANAVISGGYISALTNATVITASITNLAATTATATNFASGNVAITGGYVNNLANLTATTAQATNFSTGNARITGGYADNFPIGANTKATGAFTTLTATGQTTLTNTTNATNYQTGALVVSGGVGIAKDVYIQGNLYVANLISSTTSELIVSDPMLYLTANSIYPYNYDIGIFSQFRGGSANVYQHTGIVRSSTNTYWGFFSNVITEPSTVINWADASLIWDPVRAGELTLSNTTPSTSTSTGALKVSGGAGIVGNVNAGNVTTSMTTGTVMGNVGNFNNLYGTFYGTIAGQSGSANVSLYQAISDASVNSSHYIAMYDKAAGNAAAYTDGGLTYNPSTGVLTATTVSATTVGATNGAIATLGATNFSTGNAVISGGYISALTNAQITTATVTNFSSGNIVFTNATSGTVSTANVSLYESVAATTTNATFYPFLADKTSGNTSSFTASTLTYNPSTGLLSATTFSGAGAFTTLQATNFSTGNAVISGGYINNLANITAASSIIGTMSASSANISGPLFATSLNTANAVISGGYISALTNATVTTATVTTLNAVTATAATLNATVGNVTTLYAGSLNTANAVISGGYISALTNATVTTASVTNLAATTATATNFASGNIAITGGYISGLVNVSATTATIGTLNVATEVVTTLNATAGNITTLYAGSLNTANAVITGGYINNLANLSGTNGQFTNFSSGNIFFTNATSGTVSTANVALYDSIAASTANATFYPQVVDKASGNVAAYSVSSFTINPSTGLLSATTFSGSGASLTNLPATAVVGTVTTSNVSLYESISASTTNATFYPQLVDKATGNAASYSAAYVTVNPSTNTLSANVFSGAVTATTITSSSTIVASGNIVAAASTESTSTTTGALVVVGGTGIAGNVTAGKAAIFNSSKTAGMDFVVRGKTDNTLIWARPGASYDQVVIGNSATTSTLVTGAKLIVNTTDSIMVPVGTTAQRPSSTGGTDTAGMVRYNSTSNVLEFYNGSSWVSASSVFTTVTDTQFNGDGSTVGFTSANFTSATTNGIIVSINGVVQIPSLAYSLTGTTITFTEAPASGDVIDVRVLLTTSTVTSISSLNGYMTVSADNNGVYITGGTAAATNRMVIDTSGNINISGSILPSANVTYNLGNATSWFGTFYGVSTQAKYADLAENYQADKSYNPGTVLMFGGTYEVTIADANTTAVAGVVSTNPAHLMNGQLSGSNVVPLALTGRVPCMVIGPVKKGDMMVSAGFGYAKSSTNPTVGQVIGKALEDYPLQAKGVIEVVVGRL